MDKQYQQLTIEEREKIQDGVWDKKSVREIAFSVNRSPSTISRELKRNVFGLYGKYIPRLAQERAKLKIQLRGQRPRLKDKFIRKYVVAKLKADYSPEQIVGRLKIEYPEYQISHEAVYQYIYAQYHRRGYGRCIGQDLRIYLKRHHKARRPKHISFKPEKGSISNRIPIDDRPETVNQRIEYGHWEGDSMVSRKSSVGLNTIVERKSGFVLITKIKNSTKNETTSAIIERMKNIPANLRKTLTLDNGHENAGHQEITKLLDIACFFAHPYHSWERGTNENTNGLIRHYLPKGTDFDKVKNAEIKRIEKKLNTRPRKRLNYLTPEEIFNQVLH